MIIFCLKCIFVFESRFVVVSKQSRLPWTVAFNWREKWRRKVLERNIVQVSRQKNYIYIQQHSITFGWNPGQAFNYNANSIWSAIANNPWECLSMFWKWIRCVYELWLFTYQIAHCEWLKSNIIGHQRKWKWWWSNQVEWNKQCQRRQK